MRGKYRLEEMATETIDRLFTPKEIADLAKIDVILIRDWCKSGALRSVNISQSHIPRYKITLADWKAFLESKQTKPPAKRTNPA